jgi:vacuolar-type H+-ATPase subunit D/Vma8
MPRAKRTPRLGRLRRRVQILNSIYGLLVQGVDGLCVRVLDLEREQHRRARDVEDELDQEATQLHHLSQ